MGFLWGNYFYNGFNSAKFGNISQNVAKLENNFGIF